MSRNHALCVKQNADGTSGYDACPIACLACEGSEDSTTWYSNSKPQNDCAWIAKNADARCGKKDEDRVPPHQVHEAEPEFGALCHTSQPAVCVVFSGGRAPSRAHARGSGGAGETSIDGAERGHIPGGRGSEPGGGGAGV